MGVVDFHPSSDVGVVYLTEADLVGDSYKAKLLKLAKVLENDRILGVSITTVKQNTRNNFYFF